MKDQKVFKQEIHQFPDGSIGYAELTLDTSIQVGKSKIGEAKVIKDNLSEDEVKFIKLNGVKNVKLDKDNNIKKK